MPIFCHRVEHQNDSDPPSGFLLTSIITDIVHYLSGLTSTTPWITSATNFTFFTSLHWKSPWSVFQYGSYLNRLFLLYFHYFTLSWDFFILPSRYLFSIGLPEIFSLGCFYHPFMLHYQTTLLYSIRTLLGYHQLWPIFPDPSASTLITTPQRDYHQSFFLFVRHY